MSDNSKLKQDRIALASNQQHLASDPKYSVWVEASAGTGKTKVLSDRVLRLLLNGTRPERILCLTYTKAAASEMNNRIASSLAAWAVLDDNKLSLELSSLLGLNLDNYDKKSKILSLARNLFAILLDTPGGIKIQTIHSFCQEILKRFPLEAKISPYFEVMDDRDSKDALEKIKHDLINDQSDNIYTKAMSELSHSVSEYTFPLIMSSITKSRGMLEEYLSRFTDINQAINHTAQKLDISPLSSKEDYIAEFWNNISLSQTKYMAQAFASGSDKNIKDGVNFSKAIETKDFSLYCQTLLTGKLEPRKTPFVKAALQKFPEALNYFNAEAQRIIFTLNKLKSLTLFNSTKNILLISNELLSRYRNYKNLHSKMDYNDLINITAKLLKSPKVADWVLYKLDGGIDNLLIDEAQDTSPEQWSVIKSLTQEFFSGAGIKDSSPSIFVVGDRKQSIYSFQGADPQEFEKMHQYFSSQTANFRNVNMDVSFRSTSAVLDLVNSVFSEGPSRSGVALEGQNINHIPARIGDGGKIEFWPVFEPQEDDNANKIWLPPVEKLTIQSSSARLAATIAQNIKSIVENPSADKSRTYSYKDFLILVQVRNSFVEEIVRACKNISVPITGVDKLKLTEQIAVHDLLAVAKFALLKDDDLNLACILKSPLFGLDDNDLFKLCYNRQNTTLWQRLNRLDEYKSIAYTLGTIKNLALTLRPFEFFSYILTTLSGKQKFVSRLGFDCEDTLSEFINLTIDFERNNIPSLQLFVDWMLSDEVEIKRNMEQNNSDAVRLMTVHASKGLQAPIVILPDTVRTKSTHHEPSWLKDQDSMLFPLSKSEYNDICNSITLQNDQKQLDEYHRLLYVALTRAGERLCICGYKNKSKVNEDSWYSLIEKAVQKIALPQDNGNLVYNVNWQNPPQNKPASSAKITPHALPSWLFSSPKEEGPLAKPLTPSHQEESTVNAISPLNQINNQKLYSRGRLIHKLLELLPNIEPQDRLSAIQKFLSSHAKDFSKSQLEQISSEVLSLVNDPRFAPLFSKNSIAEVSLMGQVKNNIIYGQIDRLVITPSKVMIVDYKTNRPAAQSLKDVPSSYIKQLQAYKSLVSDIYPDLNVETYILWTNTAQMMKIE